MLARLKKVDKQRLEKSSKTNVSVRYDYLNSECPIQRLCSGDSGIVFAVQTPFKDSVPGMQLLASTRLT